MNCIFLHICQLRKIPNKKQSVTLLSLKEASNIEGTLLMGTEGISINSEPFKFRAPGQRTFK